MKVHNETQKTLQKIFILISLLISLIVGQEEQQTMSLDVKDTDIRDAVRMISRGYDLNIILDKDVTGKVTLHLTDVPIMEGLESLAESNGLEVVREGTVYRMRKKVEESKSLIRYSRGKLTVDVQNEDVHDFIRELSSKTAVSIVADTKVEGKVSGTLYQVKLDDGLRALLEGNGFKVLRRRNIYQVSSTEEQSGGAGGLSSRRRRVRRPSGGSSDFFVDYMNDKLTIEVSNGNLEDVLNAITEQTDVEIVTYGNLKAEVNAKLYDKSLTDAFALLLGGTKYTFVEKDNIILIGDRNTATPSGQALSKSELVHLNHIKADDVPKILPKNIPANNVKVIKEQNALLVSGTSEDIVKAREFLTSIDIPTPQVRIDVVIVEYREGLTKKFGLRYFQNRKDQKMYGIFPGDIIKSGDNSTEVNFFEAGIGKTDLLKFFGQVGFGKQTIRHNLPKNFYAIIKMLESENRAKVLAQPSILTLNGHKATINVDETQYFSINVLSSTTSEQLTQRIQPIKFGIRLNITPWISKGGQITAEIAPEVSDGAPGEGDYPDVSTRSLSTTVRINDGQTLSLGGLIKNKESVGAAKIPLLGNLPIIGALFRQNDKTNDKTNLVVYITPHIVTPDDTVDLDMELDKYDVSGMDKVEKKLYNKVVDIKNAIHNRSDNDSETEDMQESDTTSESSIEPGLNDNEETQNSVNVINAEREDREETFDMNNEEEEEDEDNKPAAPRRRRRPRTRPIFEPVNDDDY